MIAKIKWYIRRLGQMLLNPRDAKRVVCKSLSRTAKGIVLRRLPDVINVGRRAVCRRVSVSGKECLKKTFDEDEVGMACFEREMLAQRLFAGRAWLSPMLSSGPNWFVSPLYSDEARLDRAVAGMDEATRRAVARQVGWALFDIFAAGFAHRDFHARNLFWVDGQLRVTDFEMMGQYPEGQRPAFPVSYDIVGRGLDSPSLTGNMCYGTPRRDVGLAHLLGVSTEELLDGMAAELKEAVAEVSRTFKARGSRHTCEAGRVYGSFRLRYITVSDEEVQRNSTKRFAKFGISGQTLRGKRVLDLGSHFGAICFTCQPFEPGACVGVEYDRDKVVVAQRIAAYNGLNHIVFVQGDIDRLTTEELDGPFDVVFCLAIEAHVRKKRRLYHLLGGVTRDVLYFEGNAGTDVEMVKSRLLENGFRNVEYLGFCDDDCRPANNRRPMFVARK